MNLMTEMGDKGVVEGGFQLSQLFLLFHQDVILQPIMYFIRITTQSADR